MNNVFTNTGYGFNKMTKEEIYTAWEHFLTEERNRKYSPCIDFDCDCCLPYINTYKCFKLFVNNVLNGFLGTIREYCKIYGMSEECFHKIHKDEYIVFHRNYIGEETIVEKEIAAIFKFKYDSSSSLNYCKIIRNFSEEEGKQPVK